MLTLYHSPMSRSSRFIWLLEEIGEPYEIRYVTIRRMDGSGGQDPANLHPEGKVPALVHDGALVMESPAIALYLTDLFPGAGLGPAVGDAKRGEYLTWLFYYASELEPVMFARMSGRADEAGVVKSYNAVMHRLTRALHAGPWLLGDQFSAADVMFGSAVQWMRGQFPEDEVFDRYAAALSARPAAQRAQAKDSPPEAGA